MKFNVGDQVRHLGSETGAIATVTHVREISAFPEGFDQEGPAQSVTVEYEYEGMKRTRSVGNWRLRLFARYVDETQGELFV